MMNLKFLKSIIALMLLGAFNVIAQDTGTGISWETSDIQPGSPILVDENFQGFSFFHGDENADQGNSQHALAEDGETVIFGYTELEKEVSILNGGGGVINFSFFQCAFAPDWMAAWAYRDLNSIGSGENTKNVSNGLIEISRFDTVYAQIPTLRGYFTIDLRSIQFVEMIQWTHSSTGGRRRGVMCEFSVDDGASWDTLRYQPGSAFAASFTKDIFTGEKTYNTINCEPSAYGMTWADAIYAENVMLRFREAGGQALRVHDLKVYGDYTPNEINDFKTDPLNIYLSKNQIILSQAADVKIYNISGVLVKIAKQSNRVSMDGHPSGIYFVKASHGVDIQTQKILLN